MSAVRRLLRNENNINFPGLWKRTITISTILILIALGSLVFRGLNLGIEFEGGASWEVRSPTVTSDQLQAALEPVGLGDARIQKVANELWRVRAETESAAALEEVKVVLAEAAGIDQADVTANAVGASWGQEVTAKARTALIVFFIVLFIYISIRLEWKMAVGALAAVAHDILLTVGIYALFQLEVTSATVIAFLTILGYSLYDTLVVFDKIRENERRATGAAAMTYTEVTSFSLNQVLMRSVNTTITSVLPVLAVLVVGRYILGAVTLQEFAIALLVGLIVGTYSSLFVATPIVAWLKEREAANVERQIAATKRSTEELDIAQALDDADRSRKGALLRPRRRSPRNPRRPSGNSAENHRDETQGRQLRKGQAGDRPSTNRRNQAPPTQEEALITAQAEARSGNHRPRP